MSIAGDMQAGTWGQDVATHGDQFSLATTEDSGLLFYGVLTPREMIDPDTGFRDPREFADLEVRRSDCPGILLDPDAVFAEMRITGRGNWSVVVKEDNPADYAVKFTLVKNVTGLDT